SSWYVWSELGMYPQTPGAAGEDTRGGPARIVENLGARWGGPFAGAAPRAASGAVVPALAD
ncbi:hypothetical protein, partial [Streptomyces sp. NPDC046978]|uniref:hypothetical protein n=1 Tax=Streptomyces sp. NPDC046978 TaxID=3154704 RepID=UPI0033CD19AA